MLWPSLPLLLLMCVADPSPDPVAAGQIAGAIDLPAPRPSRRSLRGAAYRSRNTTRVDSTTADSTGKKRSRFGDVVISAHPLSFVPSVSPLSKPPRMEQQDAQFQPRVLPIPVGSRVLFVNQDPFYHNVFSLSPAQKFDVGRRPAGEEVGQLFPEPGRVSVFCDIHPQMNATVLVLDTPYYTQPDSTGYFLLQDLPTGDYVLRFFHPRHEAAERQIRVEDGTPVVLQIDFTR